MSGCSDSSGAADDAARSDWRRSALLTAVQEARELSLTVDVTGDLGAIGRLTGERDQAVGLAVKQCLVNVLRHAQVSHAEVVIIGSASDVSVMVIDAGRGFSEQLVGLGSPRVAPVGAASYRGRERRGAAVVDAGPRNLGADPGARGGADRCVG